MELEEITETISVNPQTARLCVLASSNEYALAVFLPGPLSCDLSMRWLHGPFRSSHNDLR